jgi:hypothetical protein
MLTFNQKIRRMFSTKHLNGHDAFNRSQQWLRLLDEFIMLSIFAVNYFSQLDLVWSRISSCILLITLAHYVLIAARSA